VKSAAFDGHAEDSWRCDLSLGMQTEGFLDRVDAFRQTQ